MEIPWRRDQNKPWAVLIDGDGPWDQLILEAPKDVAWHGIPRGAQWYNDDA